MNTILETKKDLFTATELITECLLDEKVEKAFTASTKSLTPLQLSFIKSEKIKAVFMNHEQALVHAADGYARATGKAGFVLIPADSGFTNAITGIATAQMDSVPLVIFAVQPHQQQALHVDDSTTIDTFGMSLPLVKYHYQLKSMMDCQKVIKESFKLAVEGRPGPVIIEINENLLTDTTLFKKEKPASFKGHEKEAIFSSHLLQQVNHEIKQAKKPVIFIGGGVNIAGASHLVKYFAEKANIPVVSTMMGLGAFPSNHPLYLGYVGMHGTFAANRAVNRADLLLCLGLRFSDRVTGNIKGFSPNSRKIQVDIDASEMNKIIPVDLPIVGDVKEFLQDFQPMVEACHTEQWVEEVQSWNQNVPRYSEKDSNSLLKPQQVIELLNNYSHGDALVATDVGQHQIWTSHYYKFSQERTFITSGGLGTMGYGVPAAIGAAFAETGKDVILVSGDGSFQMNFQELSIIAAHQLPIKIAILKNSYLGMVRQWQEMFYKKRYSSVHMTSPNFVTLAEAYGIQGAAAKSLEDAEKVISQAFQTNKPFLMEFDVTEEENVFPIVPPGANNTAAILK